MSSACPLQHHPHGCCLLISRHKGGSRPSLLLPLPKGTDSRTGSPGGGQSRRMMAVLSDTPASLARGQLQSASLPDSSVSGEFCVRNSWWHKVWGLSGHTAQMQVRPLALPWAWLQFHPPVGLAPSVAPERFTCPVGLNLSCQGQRRRTAQVLAGFKTDDPPFIVSS